MPGITSRQRAVRLLCAVALALLVALLNVGVQQHTGGRAPFLAYFPMLIVATLYMGVEGAVLSLLVALGAGMLLWPPATGWLLPPAGSEDVIALGYFLAASAMVIAVTAPAARANAGLREAQARLDAAQAANGLVEWEWDLARNRVRLSKSAQAVFGATWTDPAEAYRLVHPLDREQVTRQVQRGLEQDQYQFTSRMLRPGTQETRWIETRAVVHRGADGRARQVTGVALDVTDKVRALEAAHDAERKFQVALKSAAIIVWTCDAQRRYDWIYNPANGFDPGQFIGKPVGGAVEQRSSSYEQAVETAWTTRQPVRGSVEWNHAGRTHHYVSYIDPVLDSEGAVVGLVGASVDVTALLEARQATREVRQELQAIVDTMPSGVYRCDAGMRYVWANEKYLELMGIPRETLLGSTMAQLMSPATWAIKQPHVERVLRGEHVQFEQAVQGAGGRTHWIHAAYSPTRDKLGNVEGWVGVVTDLTERHNMDAAMRESEERLRLALEGADIGMWTTDLLSARTECTPRNLQIFGLDPAETHQDADHWYGLIEPADRERVSAAWQETLESGALYRVEYRIRRRSDQAPRWVLSRGVLRRDASGRPTRMLGVTMDITERRRAESDAVETSRRKDEFLAMLAHELRNPLAPIRYVTKLLRADTPPEMIEDAGRMIERQLTHMARLLDDLLDVSRISRGVLELRREPMDLRGVVEAAVADLRPLAGKVDHDIALRLPDAALMVSGDGVRLLQVFNNLIGNAIRYTDPGGSIVVEVVAGETEVVATVRDTGIGIAPELRPRLFELFTQGERVNRGSKGLGIGLALSRQLVVMHGGTLEAHSAGVGQGSEFTVRLPRLTEAPAVAPGGASAANVVVIGAAQTPVLIVDDNVDAADSLAQVLALAGYAPKVAYDGVTALEIAEILRPAVVLLDLGLPGMSGHDVARRLRAHSWGARVRIIAVTGWGQEAERQRSRDAGIDEHLTKPVDPNQLLHSLARFGPGAAAAVNAG